MIEINIKYIVDLGKTPCTLLVQTPPQLGHVFLSPGSTTIFLASSKTLYRKGAHKIVIGKGNLVPKVSFFVYNGCKTLQK